MIIREPSVIRKDLQSLALVRPPRDNPELETLAVLHLDNQHIMHLLFKTAASPLPIHL